MNVLFLTQIIPYPPDAGPRVKTWNVLRSLAESGHQITLASFVRPDEEQHIHALREICKEVHTVPMRRSRIADIRHWFRSNLTGRPFLVERDDVTAMRLLVQRLLTTEAIDVIHVDQLTMTQFALPALALARGYFEPGGDARPKIVVGNNGSKSLLDWPTLVFDAHNAVWTIVERMGRNAAWFLKPLARRETERLKRYEGLIAQNFDHTLAVTERDRKALLEAVATANDGRQSNARITVVPISIDTSQEQPIQRQAGSLNIVAIGSLHYPPNADGIRWFLREIFPEVHRQVPGVKLTIIGKNPPKDFLDLAARQPESIRVTGYVPDLNNFLQEAALIVVPVRSGGGMRVRILEAFARGIPIVTTSIGLEGIDAQSGTHLLVADQPDDFARAVVQLLLDQGLQSRLVEASRRLVEECYDRQVVLGRMVEMYRQIEERRKANMAASGLTSKQSAI